MDTLIVSWYDGGYNWSIRLLNIKHSLKNEAKEKIKKWYQEIKIIYETSSTKEFVNYVFRTCDFINTLIICEDGYIEAYNRREGRME